MKRKELTMEERRKISKLIAERYRKGRKKEKKVILDEFVSLTGYNRCYASWLLRHLGKKYVIYCGKRRYVIVGEARSQKGIRKRPIIYDEEVVNNLKKIWYILDMPSGKRLAPYLKEIVAKLEEKGELKIDKEVREKLMKISAATIDRLLKEEKKKWCIKNKSHTKPGTLLKSQIPVRTFAEWDEKRPGFVEIDLVAHDGGNARGEYAQTLDVTDVFTGWTETQAVKNKAQIWTLQPMKEIKERLPFPLLGIDSDNGSEFINAHFTKFCEKEKITFTRSRPNRKNDNCFVEQKNYSIVRKAVGYYRYDTEEELELLNEIYRYLRLYTNFFQPVMKLVEKERIGSKVRKRYDLPKTPYQRIMECNQINQTTKDQLRKIYESLNPAELKRRITQLQNQLFDMIKRKKINEKRKLEKEEVFI